MVEGYETARERKRRHAMERRESTRAMERANRETFEAVLRALPSAFERLRLTPADCMIEVMRWRLWRRKPVAKRCVPGWFIGTAPFQWRDASNSYGGMRKGFAIGNDGRLYLGSNGVGDRREFQTMVPELRFESFDQLATQSLQELLQRLQAAGAG